MNPAFKNFNTSDFIRFLQETLLHKPIIEYRKLKRGSGSLNFFVKTIDEQFLIKLCVNHNPESIEQLFRIYETLKKNSKILTVKPIRIEGKSSFLYNHQYGFILTYLPWKSLRFHQIKYDDFQKILKAYAYFLQTDWKDKSIIIPAIDWSREYIIKQEKIKDIGNKFFSSRSSSRRQIKNFLGKCLYHQILKNFNKISVSKEGILQNTIIYGDFHNNNILFKNNQSVAFIDFEEVRFGCISEDLMRYIFCLIYRSPFVIISYFHFIKWLSLCQQQFHLTEKEWIWGLHAFFLRRIDGFLGRNPTKLISLIKYYWIILRYRLMYQILTYLFRKGFFVK